MAMEEREKQVYLARLAEQAERYDGTLSCFPILIISISPFLILLVFFFFFWWGIHFLFAELETICRFFFALDLVGELECILWCDCYYLPDLYMKENFPVTLDYLQGFCQSIAVVFCLIRVLFHSRE